MKTKKLDIYEMDKDTFKNKQETMERNTLSNVGALVLCRFALIAVTVFVLFIIFSHDAGIENIANELNRRQMIVLTVLPYTIANLLVFIINRSAIIDCHIEKCQFSYVMCVHILISALGVQALHFFLNTLGTYMGISAYQATSYFSISEDFVSNTMIGVYLIILAPIAEELFFRKLLIDKLKGCRLSLKIMLPSLLFGLSHGNIVQAVFTMLTGMLFAYMYVCTGTIKYTIALHMLCNISSFIWGVVEYKNETLPANEYVYYGICVCTTLILIVVLVKKHIATESKEKKGSFYTIKENFISVIKTPTLVMVIVLYSVLTCIDVYVNVLVK